MYNLILKEFLVQKKTLLYGFIYTIFTAYAFKNMAPNGSAMYTIAPVAVIYLFITYSCGFDDKSKADVIFNSLPVKREEIVISKYISVFFFAVFGILCSSLLGIVGIYTGIPSVERLISINDIVFVLAAGIIFAAIHYPLYFKFGVVKMKFVNIVIFMGFIFLPSLAAEYAEKNAGSAVVKYIETLLISKPMWILQMFLGVVVLIALLISLLVSMHIYKAKDF